MPLLMFFSTWGAYDQIFSQFLKITFNNAVKKFAKIHERKVAYAGSPIFKRRNFTQLYRTSNKENLYKIFLQISNFFLQYFEIF